VGSGPRPADTDVPKPSASWTTYTSGGYDSADDGQARRTAAWLEEQSLSPFIREVAKKSIARLDIQPGESILEVGCGTGVFLPGLAALAGERGRVVGLDQNVALLDDARRRLAGQALADRVELVDGDAMALPFADATFDAAHCERVLMHVVDPAVAVREMVRVVRPGGRVVAAEVYAAAAGMDVSDLGLLRETTDLLVSGNRNPNVGIQLRRLFVEGGLRDVGGDVVGLFEEELNQEEAEEIARIARELGKRSDVGQARGEAMIAELEDRRARGAYCGLALIFVVSGRVPEGDADGG
jgi:ubiquinone/menaquinone biosynthesis C-methylase UbiE